MSTGRRYGRHGATDVRDNQKRRPGEAGAAAEGLAGGGRRHDGDAGVGYAVTLGIDGGGGAACGCTPFTARQVRVCRSWGGRG